MKTAYGFAIALVMTALSVLPGRADADAQKFLEGIYSRYVGQDAQGAPLNSNEAILSYFTPEVAALIALDAQRSQENDETPALDGDPFVGAQDWEIKDVVITVRDTGPGKATGVAKFTNLGQPETVELDLKKLDRGWRVDEIRWSDGSLRAILKGAASPEEDLPGTQKL
jgi:hypothetical protein